MNRTIKKCLGGLMKLEISLNTRIVIQRQFLNTSLTSMKFLWPSR